MSEMRGGLRALALCCVAVVSLAAFGAEAAFPEQCDFPFVYKGEVHFGCMPYYGRPYCISRTKEWERCDDDAGSTDDISGAVSPSRLDGSPGALPLAEAFGSVKINEVLPRPEGEIPGWVEVRNDGDAPADLSGLTVANEDDNATLILGAGECPPVIVPAGGYLILFNEMANKTRTCLTLPFAFGKSDAVILSFENQVVDRAEWKKKTTPVGATLGRAGDSVDAGKFELLMTPTPLRQNSEVLGHGPYGIHYFGGEKISGEAGTVANFRSNLPIAVLKTFGMNEIPNFPKVRAKLWVSSCSGNPALVKDYGNASVTNMEDVLCTLDDRPYLDADVGIEVRGRSSQKFPKKQFSFELWAGDATAQSALSEGGADPDDFEYPLIGMPSNEDWILNGEYIDRSLVRNPLASQMWANMGRWAPRQAYVELFMWAPKQVRSGDNAYGYTLRHGAMSYRGEYRGIYALRENIKRSGGRLDLPKLKTLWNGRREGGYILEWRSTHHENLFRNEEKNEEPVMETGPSRIYFKYPRDPTYKDRVYVSSFVKGLEDALFSNDWKDEERGYPRWLDVPSFIDYFLHTEITKNMDGFISSTYMYMNHGGKLHAGPPWDFDLAFGNAAGWDGYYRGPEGWAFYGPNQNKFSRLTQWYKRLMEDPKYKEALGRRWTELRSGPLADSAIRSIIRNNKRLLSPAVRRNFQKWPADRVSTGDDRIPLAGHHGSWSAEIADIRSWMDTRLAWMDKELEGFMQGSALSVEEERERSRGRRSQPQGFMAVIGNIREEIQETFTPYNWYRNAQNFNAAAARGWADWLGLD